MFSNGFSSSISFATVLPSLVMVGDPTDLRSTTSRPLGPSATFTASAKIFTPRKIDSRARTSKIMSLAIVTSPKCGEELLLDYAEYVLFTQDEVVLAFDLHFGSCVLAEQDGVSCLDVQRTNLAVLEDLAVANRNHLSLEWLLLRSVGNDDAAFGLVLFGNALYDQTVLKGSNLHPASSLINMSGLGLIRTLNQPVRT